MLLLLKTFAQAASPAGKVSTLFLSCLMSNHILHLKHQFLRQFCLCACESLETVFVGSLLHKNIITYIKMCYRDQRDDSMVKSTCCFFGGQFPAPILLTQSAAPSPEDRMPSSDAHRNYSHGVHTDK